MLLDTYTNDIPELEDSQTFLVDFFVLRSFYFPAEIIVIALVNTITGQSMDTIELLF